MSLDNNIPDDPDPLRDRLRNDAMSERPLFSAEIHHRIMQRVHTAPRMSVSRWIEVAAAAILIAVGAFFLASGLRTARTRALNPVLQVAGNPQPNPPFAASPPISFPLTLNMGGIFSATLWPPELSIRLPIPGQSHLPQAAQLPPPSYDPPGSPEWLFARLQQPATSAQMALADVIPPDMRALAGLAKLHQ